VYTSCKILGHLPAVHALYASLLQVACEPVHDRMRTDADQTGFITASTLASVTCSRCNCKCGRRVPTFWIAIPPAYSLYPEDGSNRLLITC
jgi:hypothetical protein